MISPDAKPRLADKARLQFDRHSQKHMLVYPDRGMVLNSSAAAILERCTGERTVTDIIDALHQPSGKATRADVERDVHAFLQSMLDRMLIQIDP
jgi:pyrroloquinoline quinone biosynthesis protein D